MRSCSVNFLMETSTLHKNTANKYPYSGATNFPTGGGVLFPFMLPHLYHFSSFCSNPSPFSQLGDLGALWASRAAVKTNLVHLLNKK